MDELTLRQRWSVLAQVGFDLEENRSISSNTHSDKNPDHPITSEKI